MEKELRHVSQQFYGLRLVYIQVDGENEVDLVPSTATARRLTHWLLSMRLRVNRR